MNATVETIIARLPKKALLVPAAPTPIAADAAAALSAQYAKALQGVREIVLFGAMCLAIQDALPKNVFDTEETPSFRAWLQENCPEINYNTAFGFVRLARGLCKALSVPAETDLPRLLAAAPDSLPDADRALRSSIDDALAGKSRRQLEFDFGLRTPPAPRGGTRPGAGRPGKSLLAEQVRIDSFFGEDVLERWTRAILLDRWHLRATPKAKTALLAIAKEIVSSLGPAGPKAR